MDAMLRQRPLAGERLVVDASTRDRAEHLGEPAAVTIWVEDGSTLTSVPLIARFTRLQKFSSPLVWTLPRASASAWSMT